MIERTLERAERQLNEGNLWRAKEILQGAIRNSGYNVVLFERLGIVFLRMSDLPEAGMFLFLSGVRKPEYEEAINIFLRKHGSKRPYDFVNVFPRGARLETISAYPEEVAKRVRAMGLPETLPTQAASDAAPPRTIGEVAFWITCITILLAALVLMMIGAATVMRLFRQ